MTNMTTRQEKLDRWRGQTGRPMIALTINNWSLILSLLDQEEQRQRVLTGHDHGMMALAISDIINRIENQL